MKWGVLTLAWSLVAADPGMLATWSQWGQNAQHTGAVNTLGGPMDRILGDLIPDPFVANERADPNSPGRLHVHYQVPLVEGGSFYMEVKGGTFTDVSHWQSQVWSEVKLSWRDGKPVALWAFSSDWKPVPFDGQGIGPGREPVFQPVLANDRLYVPGAGGAVWKLAKTNGGVKAHITPLGPDLDPDTYISGPLTADRDGNIYYNVVKLVHGQEWSTDLVGAWLVKISANDRFRTATYSSLVPGAPKSEDSCLAVFSPDQLPWPPSPTAVPPSVPCGSQRAGINVAPAVAPDNTVYTVSRAHLTGRTGYLVAVHPDLTPKWAASLRDRLHTGCNVLLPANGTPGGCRIGAADGVDPAQNRPGVGRVLDDSTSSPTVAPDGSILYGAYTRYNYNQGHLMKFSADGTYQTSYPFGWDLTPAIFHHGRTHSVIIKDNRYAVGSYCDVAQFCPPHRSANDPAGEEGFFITQLDAGLRSEWSFKNTNTESCSRDAEGHVTCVADHPQGFEWCVNAAAVDGRGVVYANSEDGAVYAINQGGTLRTSLFLQTAQDAAYTPLSIGADGKLYCQNNGHLLIVGR